MKTTRRWNVLAGMLLAALMVTLPLAAQREGKRKMDPAKMMDRQMATLKEELKLTADQEATMRTILEDSAKKSMALREKYGRPEPGKGQNTEARDELRKIQEETNEKLKTVLSEEQMQKYHDLRRQRMERFGPRKKG